MSVALYGMGYFGVQLYGATRLSTKAATIISQSRPLMRSDGR